MSEGERKLVDTASEYLYAVRDGEAVSDPTWRACRLVLTSERLVLATDDGTQAVPHGRSSLADAAALPDGIEAPGATPLQVGDAIVLVDAPEIESFEREYCRAVLHDAVIFVKTPATVGGVVQEDAAWQKARFRLEDDRIVLGLPGNRTAAFPIEDVGTVETDEAPVQGETRPIVRVAHTDDESRAVETHFSGTAAHKTALEGLLDRVLDEREGEYDLSQAEKEVLMALYSGVSPFEMAEFVGLDVDEVEEIYQYLLEVGAVDKVRERTEVTLNTQGRNMASEAMNEE